MIRLIATFVYQWLIMGALNDELKFSLELLGVNPNSKTVEEMIEPINGEN